MRVRVYVDGFNLYYGSLKGTPYKWLDLAALTTDLLPEHRIDAIRYFTAHVSGKQDPGAPLRQEAYLRALRTIPGLTLHFGRFLTEVRSMPGAPPAGGLVRVLKTEEKGSDVNLATYLLCDGFDGLYDLAVVVSNDSDLTEPIRVAKERFGLVGVYSPNPHRSHALAGAASWYRHLPAVSVAAAQFPATVLTPDGRTVVRPARW